MPKDGDSDCETTFLGWIPCVSGHLDFSLMSVGLEGAYIPTSKWPVFECIQTLVGSGDNQKITVNFESGSIGEERRIFLLSWVDWKDSPMSKGKTYVVVLAKSTLDRHPDKKSISGTVLLLPKADFVKNCELWSEAQSLRQSEGAESWEQVETLLLSSEPLGKCALNVNDVHAIDFTICSKGFVTLKYRLTYPELNRHITKSTKETECRQSFYYLKYAIHSHTHHKSGVDALTTIVPLGTNDEDKEIAGLMLVGQLKREITKVKRATSVSGKIGDHSALGISGYMHSLICSLEHAEYFSGESVANREKEHLRGAQISLRAQQQKVVEGRDGVERRESARRQWLAFILTIWTTSCLIWLNLRASVNGALKALSKNVSGDQDWVPLLLRPYLGESGLFYGIAISVVMTIVIVWMIQNFKRMIEVSGVATRFIYRTSYISSIISAVLFNGLILYLLLFW